VDSEYPKASAAFTTKRQPSCLHPLVEARADPATGIGGRGLASPAAGPAARVL